MKTYRAITIAVLVTALLAGMSCTKNQLETTYNKQEDQIDQYITKNMVVKTEDGGTDTLRVVRNGGSNRLVLKEGTALDRNEADRSVNRPLFNVSVGKNDSLESEPLSLFYAALKVGYRAAFTRKTDLTDRKKILGNYLVRY